MEEALAQREAVYPQWHPTLAKSVLSLGSRYEALGQFSDAEATYRRAAATLQRWSCMLRVAIKFGKSGQTERAKELLDEVFSCCGESLGETHPLRGLAGTHLGEACRRTGDYERALEKLSVCAEIWKANSNTYELANCLNSQALVHQQLGDFGSAEEAYLAARRLLREHSQGRGLQLRLTADANYASLLEDVSRFPESIKIYEAVVTATEAAEALSPADLTARENLARLYQRVGELAKAETLLDALLAHRGRPPIDMARFHSLRGRFYLQVGALEKADPELDIALEYFQGAPGVPQSDVAEVRGLKALGLLERGELRDALALYEQVLAVQRKELGNDHIRCAATMDQIAKVHRKLGAYSDAIEAHREAIDIYQSTHGPSHDSVAWAYHRLGTTHFLSGNNEEAGDAWRRSFEIKQTICQETLSWLPEAQATAFLTSLTTNDSSAGRDTLISTLCDDTVRNAEEAFLCVWRSRGLVLNAIANRERRLLGIDEDADRARLADVRRRLAQLSLYGGGKELPMQVKRQQLLQTLNAEKESLERLIAEKAANSLKADATDAPISDVHPSDLLRCLPVETVLVQLVRTERWQPQEGQSAEIQKGAVYDAFAVYMDASSDRDRQDELQVHWVELGNADEIDRQIETWRKGILSGGGGTRGKRLRKPKVETAANRVLDARRFLSERVWGPISKVMAQRSRVVIVPDGKLHLLPWDALPGESANYLIEEKQITTAADGRQLAELYRHSKRQAENVETSKRQAAKVETSKRQGANVEPQQLQLDRYLVVGGIQYDSPLPKPTEAQSRLPRETVWPFLPGTEKEVSALASILPTDRTQVLVGAQATEESVKRELEEATVIHIATHGYYADEVDEDMTAISATDGATGTRETSSSLADRNPLLQCGLTLSGCNADIWIGEDGLPIMCKQDGYLSAEEIMGMDLSGVRLAVLSACETGLGTIGGGEGVFGLQRALHVSGVQATIASGWKVDDRATELLMTFMYEKQLVEGLSPADALHAAKLTLLKQFSSESGRLRADQAEAAQPYYWAAFTHCGVLE